MTLFRALVLAAAVATAPGLACHASGHKTEVPEGAAHVVLSLQKIDCDGCGTKAIASLGERPGVYAVTFDRALAELSIDYDPAAATPLDFIGAMEALGYGASEGAGAGRYLPPVGFPDGLDVRQISKAGEYVELQSNLAPGKVTVFDFHAAWCGPCRKLDEHLIALLQANPDVAVRKIDIVDWDSEVAKAYLTDASELPYVEVFGTTGRRVARISGLQPDSIVSAVQRGMQ